MLRIMSADSEEESEVKNEDENLPPPPRSGQETPRLVDVEQSEYINPFHDVEDQNQSATSSVSENIAHIKQPTMPHMGLDLLKHSLDDQHPTTLADPLKPNQTSKNEGLATNLDPFHNSEDDQLPKPSEDIQVQHLVPVANLDSQVSARSVSVDSPKYVQDSYGNRGLVDTVVPFKSVKVAVSKFVRVVDWRAHKIQTAERCKFIDQELDKAQVDDPIYRKMSNKAEEMKLGMERPQIEQHKAKQDIEFVKLLVEEMEKGIAKESSVATKVQLEVAKVRQKVEQDVTESKEVEKMVQDLIIELIKAKKLLEFAPMMHPQPEGSQLTTAIAAEQRSTKLKEVEDEFKLFARETADNIAALLTRQSRFYCDMWVDGKKIMLAEPPEVVKA
ncbi:hypothetical protein QQ045_025668 [Rhodiola kirilowii]